MAQGARVRDEADALLYHPDVVRIIRAIMIVFRFPEQDLGDRVGDVQERFLDTTPPDERPKELPGMKAMIRKVAYNVGREKVKELVRHGKYDKGPTEGADDQAKSLRAFLEPHEEAKIREIIEQIIREEAAGKHTGVILGDMMVGAPPRETSKDTGIPSSQMRKKTSQLRKLLRNRLVQAGISVAALLAVFGGAFAGYEHKQELDREASFDANAAPPPDMHRTVEWAPLHGLPPEDKAAALREKAVAACANKEFERCENELDMAQMWDPTSDKLPEVIALRKTLSQFEAKPRKRQ